MNTKESKKRTINKLIIKGYPEVSEKNLINLLDINLNNIINNEKLNEISTTIKDLNFISQRKNPEILFKRDSTLLYLYLKKEKNNSFDGIINFTSKEEQNGILFTGHLRLDLNNTFNRGGNLNFIWEANGEKTQNLSISTSLPYLLNTPLIAKINFKLHKQDSTFTNNSISTTILYNINSNSNIGLTYDSENSKNTLIRDNYSSFKNNFIGIEFSYRNNKKLTYAINPSFGIRNSDNNKENQFKFTSNISYLYKINNKNAVSIKNETSILLSNSELTNELYRIGGANSMRGFDEESIFTSKYSFINLEYHYHTSLRSYFYSVSDIGLTDTNSYTNKLLGFGLGYSFSSNNNKFNISFVLGKTKNKAVELHNNKLIVSFISFF